MPAVASFDSRLTISQDVEVINGISLRGSPRIRAAFSGVSSIRIVVPGGLSWGPAIYGNHHMVPM